MNRFQFFSLIFGAVISAVQAVAADAAAPAPAKPQDKKEKEKHAVRKTYKNLGVESFDKMRSSKTNVVLDVRTKKEFEEGHIPGAVMLDFKSPDFEKELKKLDPGKTYLVHCASGGRSAQACEKLEKLNFPKVYNLEGGLKAWEKEGKPVEKGPGEKAPK